MAARVTGSEETANEAFALERRFPGTLRGLPRFPLTTLPTPVRALDRLAGARGIGALWTKCDDRSGRIYGGNKPRKLDFLLGEARQRNRRSVLTFGGLGTHHGLATAIGAGRAGMRTLLLLVPQPVTEHVRHCLLLQFAHGAEMHCASSPAGAVAMAVRLWVREYFRGSAPAVIPLGGTSAVGMVGYVNAALEFAEQVRGGEAPEPDWIFVPLGSGGTAAGLVLGLKLAGLRSRVAAVLVTDIFPPTRARLARQARATLRRLRRVQPAIPQVSISAEDFVVVRGFGGRCYGDPTEEARQALRWAAEHEDLSLETTYTAKCLAAVLHLAGDAPYRGGTLLFWNTYNSVPLPAAADLPDFRQLPVAFHRFFV